MAWSKEEKEIVFEDVICDISSGKSLIKALKDSALNKNTFYKWINEDDTKKEQYARAREDRADLIFEDILHIADDTSKDTKTVDLDGVSLETLDTEAIQRSKLRIDARKWMLSKMQPKKYGDKMDVTSGGEKIKNDVTAIQVQFADFSEDEDTTE